MQPRAVMIDSTASYDRFLMSRSSKFYAVRMLSYSVIGLA